MADENKTQDTQKEEQKSCCCGSGAGFKVFAGLIFIVLGLLAVYSWWPALWTVIKGCLGIILILIGAITIAIAKE